MSEIALNLECVQERICLACRKSNRDPSKVRLLLATKTVDAERIKLAIEAGCSLIAENRIQELKQKYDFLKTLPHTNHFIGHLQTNKIKDLLRCNVSCIQSLDRIELAEKLNQRLRYENKTIDVLIQVNTSGEESKFGVYPAFAIDFVRQIVPLKNLHIKELMTIGLLGRETEKVRACFRLLKKVQQQIIDAQIESVAINELSMGMSNDLEIAIEEGATIVRVGTAIFGVRPTSDSYYWNENT